jgi:hypothetical protein
MTVRPPTPPPLPDELDRLLRRLRMPYVRQAAPEVLATARRSTLNKSPHGRGDSDHRRGTPIERMWPRTVSGRSSAACRDFVELGGQSDKSPRQPGRDHVDLGCGIDLGAHSRRQLMDAGGSGVGHAAGVAHLRVSAGELIRAAARGGLLLGSIAK